VRSPGPLLASGREADIFECGEGRVLRRSRQGRSMTDEARTMAYARDHGYPVPAVEELSDDGLDLVMERIDGVSMVDAVSRRPWTIARQGRVLGDLHRRLHELPAPGWVPPAPCGAPGDRLVHLDLHPLNVMVTRSGPVVIDWPRASAGDPDADVALTWALMASGEVDAGPVMRRLTGRFRAAMLAAFLSGFDVDAVRLQLPSVVGWKSTDVNMTAGEGEAMRALL
jgi:aminoglycoside phosphotransferase (APT) family kinase protein